MLGYILHQTECSLTWLMANSDNLQVFGETAVIFVVSKLKSVCNVERFYFLHPPIFIDRCFGICMCCLNQIILSLTHTQHGRGQRQNK